MPAPSSGWTSGIVVGLRTTGNRLELDGGLVERYSPAPPGYDAGMNEDGPPIELNEDESIGEMRYNENVTMRVVLPPGAVLAICTEDEYGVRNDGEIIVEHGATTLEVRTDWESSSGEVGVLYHEDFGPTEGGQIPNVFGADPLYPLESADTPFADVIQFPSREDSDANEP